MFKKYEVHIFLLTLIITTLIFISAVNASDSVNTNNISQTSDINGNIIQTNNEISTISLNKEDTINQAIDNSSDYSLDNSNGNQANTNLKLSSNSNMLNDENLLSTHTQTNISILKVSNPNAIYINTTGTSTEGTPENPSNWTYAYENIADGGTIYFTNGTYTNIINQTIIKNLTLTSYNDGNVIIDTNQMVTSSI
jgi:hypothetical protein